MRIAPCHVAQSARIDQSDRSYGVTAAGSYTWTSPSRLRHPIDSSITCPFVAATTTGPFHSTIAGITIPHDLPECAGPMARTL